MAELHDVLHELVDRVSFASESQRDGWHRRVDTIPVFIEQLGEEQLELETPVDQAVDDDQEQEIPA